MPTVLPVPNRKDAYDVLTELLSEVDPDREEYETMHNILEDILEESNIEAYFRTIPSGDSIEAFYSYVWGNSRSARPRPDLYREIIRFRLNVIESNPEIAGPIIRDAGIKGFRKVSDHMLR